MHTIPIFRPQVLTRATSLKPGEAPKRAAKPRRAHALALARAARLRMLRQAARTASCPEQRADAHAALMREVAQDD